MQADQLFTGGTVRTGVPGAQASGALAVAGGRVLALGQDAVDSRGPGTDVTDLAGGGAPQRCVIAVVLLLLAEAARDRQAPKGKSSAPGAAKP